MKKMVDLCAGVGGVRLPFSNLGWECVATCEIDKFCKTTYTENFIDSDKHVWYTDITKIVAQDISDFDLLCAGFPCQAFSLAGKKRGFEDTRGTIFFDVARIIKEKKPKFVLMENVKNIKSHDKGNTFKVIKKTMEDLGYFFEDFEFSAHMFVPQKRVRVYMLAIKKSEFSKSEFETMCENIRKEYDKLQSKSVVLGQILEKKVDKKYTLSDKLWNFLVAHSNKHKKLGNGFGFGLNSSKDVARTLTARYYKDGSEILIEQKNDNPRRLTPRECARIMGFPDDYKIVCSDTQAYKQFGNSVVVPVIGLFASEIDRVASLRC